jgi:hypothetical protein
LLNTKLNSLDDLRKFIGEWKETKWNWEGFSLLEP